MQWLAVFQAIVEGLKIAKQVFGWWISMDSESRKETKDAFEKLRAAELDGRRSDIRSAVNRFIASL
jgi:hypothetical protein